MSHTNISLVPFKTQRSAAACFRWLFITNILALHLLRERWGGDGRCVRVFCSTRQTWQTSLFFVRGDGRACRHLGMVWSCSKREFLSDAEYSALSHLVHEGGDAVVSLPGLSGKKSWLTPRVPCGGLVGLAGAWWTKTWLLEQQLSQWKNKRPWAKKKKKRIRKNDSWQWSYSLNIWWYTDRLVMVGQLHFCSLSVCEYVILIEESISELGRGQTLWEN